MAKKDPSQFDPQALVEARDRQSDDDSTPPTPVDPTEGLLGDPATDLDGDPAEVDEGGEPAEEQPFDWSGIDGVPDRLKGKTPAQIAAEFSSLHSEFGRQATELGQARDLVHEVIAERLQQATPEKQPKKFKLEDLEEDPDTAIRQIIREELGGVQEQLQVQEVQSRVNALESRHPGYRDIIATPEFAAWVKESEYRIGAYNRARQNLDVSAANELLVGFKQAQEARKAAQTTTAKRGQVREKSGATGGGGTAKATGGKRYSAMKLQHEYVHNRDAYNANFAEYQRAWAEGRVDK